MERIRLSMLPPLSDDEYLKDLDAYEITALIWAMNEYIHNGQFAERI